MKRSSSAATKNPGQSLSVLYLDDDPFELDHVVQNLTGGAGYAFNVSTVSNPAEFEKAVKAAPDIVLLDVHLAEGKRGTQLIASVRKANPECVILMRSGSGDVETISECLSQGADDFISKKTDQAELNLRVWNSYRLSRLKRGTDMRSVPREGDAKDAVVGETMQKVAKRIPLITKSAISAVHIHGESGTGKEVVADLFASSLSEGVPMVRVNCGAIAPTLLESELFGHVKGSFTGAQGDKKGLIEKATGGWIFLDEVATLSTQAQVALLRVLENQELLRVGDTKPIAIKVRVLSATNENLSELVAAGKFRKDLWQRLCEADINLPSLRERPGEIERLVRHFCKTMPGGPYEIAQPALDVLTNLDWELGNIRELRNCLRAMTEFHVNKLLTPLSIPERVWKRTESKEVAPAVAAAPTKGGARSSNEITVGFDWSGNVSYDLLADKLLLELVRSASKLEAKLSLRSLSKKIGVSRSTLSTRLKGLVTSNLVTMAELASLVGISGTKDDSGDDGN